MHKTYRLTLALFLSFIASPLNAFDLFWPTPNTAFLQGRSIEHYLQPTASGRAESGNFGCVRNGGYRFHEGVDLKPLKRNRQQEPIDPIYAAMSGHVAYVNSVGGNSALGKYIVLTHDELDLPIYTLYAHLSQIEPHVKKGAFIQGGTTIGIMGRTATKTIPKQLAHLHFEMGVRLGNNFESWYKNQQFTTRNYHGQWNGMNLIGFHPLDFYNAYLKDPQLSVADYVKSEPTAVTLEITSSKIPDFIKRHPKLLTQAVPSSGLKGWKVDFTWYGLPKTWTPLTQLTSGNTSIGILDYNKKAQEQFKGRKLVVHNKRGQAQVSGKLGNIIKLLSF